MLKAIVSAPAFALASRIAWRSDPAPESLVLVTVKVAPGQSAAARPKTRPAIPTRSREAAREVPGRPRLIEITISSSLRVPSGEV